MRRALIVVILLVAGCAADPSPAPEPGRSGPRAVTFSTVDGVTLAGRVSGAGSTAVVLSNMGDNDPASWEALAPELAAADRLVLTYSYRYPLRAAVTPALARGTVADLTAAVAYVRALGATRVFLVGASLGGIASGKVAAALNPGPNAAGPDVAGTLNAAGLVVLSAPAELAGYDLVVSPAELAAVTGPKLFVGSEQDDTVPLAATRAYYEQAAPPKRFVSYPGAAHGVRILAGPSGDELRALLLDFVSR